jgi:hypothetical protein
MSREFKFQKNILAASEKSVRRPVLHFCVVVSDFKMASEEQVAPYTPDEPLQMRLDKVRAHKSSKLSHQSHVSFV